MAIQGKLKSAVKLDELTIQSIKKRFEALVGEEISFTLEVVPGLLGGFVVVLGNKVYDQSVRAHLNKIKNFIMDADSPYKKEALEEEEDFSLDIDTEEFGKFTKERIQEYSGDFDVSEVGTVVSSGDGIVIVRGLEHSKYGELLEFENNAFGIVMNLSKENIGAVLLNNGTEVSEGSLVRNTGSVVQVPVGEGLLGRVVNPLGVPMDGKGKVFADKYRPIESEAPAIFDRQGVKEPLETGIIAIDSMVPIGKGQRELIIGDRQTGKTAIAVDTILNQKGKNVYCVYVAIGQKASTIASIIRTLEEEGAMEYTIVVASTSSDAPSMQYIAPYAGCAIAEEFMYNGKDVLIVYDDLSKHAVAYRTMSLLLRRPPGREAYPGDVFYLHSRLLERAAHLSKELGGGSMTALPIIETMAGDISAYIPTNVISITDGQIFLETELFNAGIRPAVNVGLSVSRVGGSAQIKAMRKVAGRLRLDLAQYRELAVFAQFASDLDKNTRETLDQGARLTETLKQPQYSPYPMASQVMLLYIAVNKYLMKIPFNYVREFGKRYLDYVDTNYPGVRLQIEKTGDLSDESIISLRAAAEAFIPIFCQQNGIKLKPEEAD
ncbi:MAG: F0F1 ATP synthase subunit alpha [Christensenellaceae bacterium]|nr:F0F1 ATP synthase subunit alpha [Christensenellaceae bacterium]